MYNKTPKQTHPLTPHPMLTLDQIKTKLVVKTKLRYGRYTATAYFEGQEVYSVMDMKNGDTARDWARTDGALHVLKLLTEQAAQQVEQEQDKEMETLKRDITVCLNSPWLRTLNANAQPYLLLHAENKFKLKLLLSRCRELIDQLSAAQSTGLSQSDMAAA